MAYTPAGLDHVNVFVRNAARSYEWYRDLFGFHTQDVMYHPGTDRPRAVFLSCDPGHAHDIALFEVGEWPNRRRDEHAIHDHCEGEQGLGSRQAAEP